MYCGSTFVNKETANEPPAAPPVPSSDQQDITGGGNEKSPQYYYQPTGGKSKTVAAVLAIFLGGFGIHKFYLRQPGWGIAYIIFCWSYIPAIIGFIEGITYLCMSEEDFDYKYNS